ncbi:hypothetical protein CIW50_27575 [Tardiphaga sp. P9-11]|nr:hypothetical protein CIW50_27575 [Tardiphaga sp. P9-11]
MIRLSYARGFEVAGHIDRDVNRIIPDGGPPKWTCERIRRRIPLEILFDALDKAGARRCNILVSIGLHLDSLVQAVGRGVLIDLYDPVKVDQVLNVGRAVSFKLGAYDVLMALVQDRAKSATLEKAFDCMRRNSMK